MDWYAIEKEALLGGATSVCGIDEAGRGPLAGPVCAACVILPVGLEIEGLNDSKKLSGKKRDLLFDEICALALDYHIAFASVQEIDELNILQATFLTMRRSFEGLTKKNADYALIDGDLKARLPIKEQPVVKGDAKSANIAAASILAKVSRDRYMLTLDEKYPQYAFAQHKGYGTKLHYERLNQYGESPEHRQSFLKKWKKDNGK